MKQFPTAILVLWALLTAPSVRAAQITVFAAASLTESLREIGTAYGMRTGDKLVFNFAASGPLARQIEEGAPADLFISADEARMDAVQARGLIVVESRRSLLSNRLVIVTAVDGSPAIASPQDLARSDVKRIALGDPKTVPAGIYGKAYLTRLGLWAKVEGRVVPCESVRAVLAAVESGNVDAGIVYKTDAAISRKVNVAVEVPAGEGPAIRYPVALVKGAREPAAAGRFLKYLGGLEAGGVFERRGFILLSVGVGK